MSKKAGKPQTESGLGKPITAEVHPLWDRPMTPKQLARFLQISTSTLSRQLRSQDFPRLVIAGRLRFVPKDVLTYYRKKSG